MNRQKIEEHFQIELQGRQLSWSRRADQIAADVRLDGVYVVCASLVEEALGRTRRWQPTWAERG